MIDLHMHTTCSDGTDSVEKLIDNVISEGVTFFSITDHDTAKACRKILKNEELKQKIKDSNITFVPGIEFSCIYKGRKVHILAYDIDPDSEEVRDFEKKLKLLMKEKDIHRFKAIEDAGFKFSEKSMEFLNSRINIRTPDVANCLKNDGFFEDIEDAHVFLKSIKYPRDYLFDAIEVISAMSKLGAKVVWAHSIYGVKQRHIPFEQVEDFVCDFKKFGLSGLECYYSLYNSEEISELVKIAEKYGLYVTCGSDYHGKNKKIQLLERSVDGTNVPESEIKIVKTFKNVIK